MQEKFVVLFEIRYAFFKARDLKFPSIFSTYTPYIYHKKDEDKTVFS